MTETPHGTNVPALEKGMDVLEFLAQQAEPCSLQEIATALHRSRGEIYRMVAWLLQREYISKQPGEDRYVIGDRLGLFFKEQYSTRTLIESCLPTMQQLSTVLDVACHLWIRCRSDGIILSISEPTHGYSLRLPIGTSMPLWRCPAGACLLSGADEIETLSTRDNAAQLADLAEQHSLLKKQGYYSRYGTAGYGYLETSFTGHQYERLASAITVSQVSPTSETPDTLVRHIVDYLDRDDIHVRRCP